MNRVFSKPSPSMVVALIALTVALGGSAYAATALAPNSVGTAQIKNGAVTPPKLAATAKAIPMFSDTKTPFTTPHTLAHVGPWTVKEACAKNGSPPGVTFLYLTAYGPSNSIGDGMLDGNAYSANGQAINLVPLLTETTAYGYHASEVTLHSKGHGSAHFSAFAYAQGPSDNAGGGFRCKVNAVGYPAP